MFKKLAIGLIAVCMLCSGAVADQIVTLYQVTDCGTTKWCTEAITCTDSADYMDWHYHNAGEPQNPVSFKGRHPGANNFIEVSLKRYAQMVELGEICWNDGNCYETCQGFSQFTQPDDYIEFVKNLQ